ncbi:G-protein coupled receptor moody [Gryllus bimaculatus]|nr:G-protein coupled receptor moody [Gryllus bimaculatus]
MITVNRYVMIAHPAACARAYRPVPLALMVAFCWVFSFGMQLPTLFGVWGKVAKAVWKEEGTRAVAGRFGYDQKLGTCSILADARGRSAKTALFVIAFLTPCAVIVACYARIFWVVHRLCTFFEGCASMCRLHVLGYLLLYLSACINPLIYVIMNKQYRQAYKAVITFRRPSRWTLTPAPTSSGVNGNCTRLPSLHALHQLRALKLAPAPPSARLDTSTHDTSTHDTALDK